MNTTLDNTIDEGNKILRTGLAEKTQLAKWIHDTRIALLVNVGPASKEFAYFDWLVSTNHGNYDLNNWLQATVTLVEAIKNAHTGISFRKSIPPTKLRLVVKDFAERFVRQGQTNSAVLLIGIILDDTLRELAQKSAINSEASILEINYSLLRAEIINHEQWEEIRRFISFLEGERRRTVQDMMVTPSILDLQGLCEWLRKSNA